MAPGPRYCWLPALDTATHKLLCLRAPQPGYFQQRLDERECLGCRHGRRYQVSLDRAAMLLRQELALILRLHAFGDNFETEGQAQCDGRATQGGVVRIRCAILHERAVDLHTVDVQQLQACER